MSISLTVAELKSLDFNSLSLEGKLMIRDGGRPVPALQIFKPGVSRNQQYMRKFQTYWYETYDWLCGSEEENLLYCFPCLLLGGDNAWSQKGIEDLTHFPKLAKVHRKTALHMKNVLDLALLDETEVRDTVEVQVVSRKHIEEVKKNREIVSKIFDCISFCGENELFMYNRGETEHSHNILKIILGFKYNVDFRQADCNVLVAFRDDPMFIQNEILDLIVEVYQEYVKREIRNSVCVSVIIEEVSNTVFDKHLVIIFRFEQNCRVREIIWGVYKLESEDTKCVSDCILEQLNLALEDDVKKLITLSYNCPSSSGVGARSLLTMIKNIYPNVRVVHYYGHRLVEILERVACQNPHARIFFSSLMAIREFFRQFSSSILGMVPFNMTDLELNTVKTVFEYKELLLSCFKELQTSKHMAVVRSASELIRIFQDGDFQFWLSFFHNITSHICVLENILGESYVKSKDVNQTLNIFNGNIFSIRKYYESEIKYEIVDDECDEPCEPKKLRLDDTLRTAAKEICDIISFEMNERLRFTGHLSGTCLLHPLNYSMFAENCPTVLALETTSAYSELDNEKLSAEVNVLFARRELHQLTGPAELLIFLSRKTELKNAFPEVITLSRMIVVTPMITHEYERLCSSLKRIKTFVNNCKNEDQLSALAILALEKETIAAFPDFGSRIVDGFVGKNSQLCVSFK